VTDFYPKTLMPLLSDKFTLSATKEIVEAGQEFSVKVNETHEVNLRSSERTREGGRSREAFPTGYLSTGNFLANRNPISFSDKQSQMGRLFFSVDPDFESFRSALSIDQRSPIALRSRKTASTAS
jgi:hypothetical protein